MVRTPEEYFADQCFEAGVSPPADGALSAAEQAFVQKYLGGEALTGLPVLQPEAVLPGTGGQPAAPRLSLRDRLRTEAQIQMVSFFVRQQIFLLPVVAIQEVLRHLPLVRLPLAPPYVAGVVNLRGRVTPLLHLSPLLTLEQEYCYTPQNFIIVCTAGEMQLGLIVDKVHSMHLVAQEKITWNIESQLGASADFLYAIADINDRVSGILAPDMIVQKLLAA